MSQFIVSSRAPIMIQRVRLRLSRRGPGAALTHLQQIEAIRRSLEKSVWPLARSQGKKSKIKISFGPAISMGYESEAEYCDTELTARLDLQKSGDSLQEHLPAGYSVMNVKSIPRFFPSLEESMNIALYEVRSSLLVDTRATWEKFWSEKQVMVTKKKQDGEVVIDARPLVRSWKLENDRFELLMRFGPGRTIKPERLIQAVCGWDESQVDVSRTPSSLSIKRVQMYFEKENGELVEP